MLFTGNVAKIVLEQHGYDVEFTSLDPAILFESIASGDIDVTLAPWLPTTHGALAEEYEGEFVEVGKNIEGGKLGLAVPSYMKLTRLRTLHPPDKNKTKLPFRFRRWKLLSTILPKPYSSIGFVFPHPMELSLFQSPIQTTNGDKLSSMHRISNAFACKSNGSNSGFWLSTTSKS